MQNNKNENHNKLIAELQKKQSQKNNPETLPAELLPPSDLPPMLTNGSMLDVNGQKLLKTLENKYKEFFKVGDSLSEKADILPDVIDGILSNLDVSIISRMPDNGVAFAIFMQEIMKSAQFLAKLSDPVPIVSAKIQNLSNMYLLDIKYTFIELRNGIVDAHCNEAFKIRAIQCVLLTMALGKLQKSKDILNNVDEEIFSLIVTLLISPLQRLAQLGLFANDAIAIFKKLHSCSNLTDFDKEIITDTLIILEELFARSKLIGIVANTIHEATDLVAMDTLEKRFSVDALKQLEFFKTLVPTYVQLTMEAEFKPEFTIQITEKLNSELESHLTLHSAKFYRKLCRLIDTSKNEFESVDNLKVKLKSALCTIHEDTTLSDETKLVLMTKLVEATKMDVTDALQNLSWSSIFGSPQSDFEQKLKSFISIEMNTNTNALQLS
jgi:hypothetical protein